MSEEEKRAIRGAALLEVEDAKSALAHLRAKAEHWRKLEEKIGYLLTRMRRDSAHLESAAAETRAEIEDNLDTLENFITVRAVLSLDTELKNAVERLKKAEAVKKDLGFI